MRRGMNMQWCACTPHRRAVAACVASVLVRGESDAQRQHRRAAAIQCATDVVERLQRAPRRCVCACDALSSFNVRSDLFKVLEAAELPDDAIVMLTHDQLGASQSRAICGVMPEFERRLRSIIALFHL